LPEAFTLPTKDTTTSNKVLDGTRIVHKHSLLQDCLTSVLLDKKRYCVFDLVTVPQQTCVIAKSGDGFLLDAVQSPNCEKFNYCTSTNSRFKVIAKNIMLFIIHTFLWARAPSHLLSLVGVWLAWARPQIQIFYWIKKSSVPYTPSYTITQHLL
jgi:hypothetical protein